MALPAKEEKSSHISCLKLYGYLIHSTPTSTPQPREAQKDARRYFDDENPRTLQRKYDCCLDEWWKSDPSSFSFFLLLPRKITFKNDLGLTSGYTREKWIQQDGPEEEFELNNYVEIWKLNFSLQHPNHAKPVAWERKKRTSCFEGTTTDFALIQLFQFNFLWLCKFRMCQESEKKGFSAEKLSSELSESRLHAQK